MRARWIVLALWTGCRSAHPSAEGRRDASTAEAPPPTAPGDLLATLRVTDLRGTLERVTARASLRVPPDLAVMGALGTEVAVLAAADLSRPMSLVIVGDTNHLATAYAMTPPSASHARSALIARYRLVHVDGLGERLERRERDGRGNPRCALVPVPPPVGAQVVCASTDAALNSAGRWVAFENVRNTNDDAGAAPGVALTLSPSGAHALAAGPLHDGALALRAWMRASADAARRAHDRPPDYGDPEAVIGWAGDAMAAVEASAAELRGVTVGVDVGESRWHVRTALTLPRDGTSALAVDSAGRTNSNGLHPLLGLLPRDAVGVGGLRSPAATHRRWARSAVGAALDVLGARVTAPGPARAALEALTAQSGDEVAVAAARDPGGALETTWLVAQSDGGRAATTALAQIAAAPWARGLRGGAAWRVTPLRAGVLWRDGTNPNDSGAAVAIGVRQGALAVVVGPHAQSSLEAVGARTLGDEDGRDASVVARGGDGWFVWRTIASGAEVRALGEGEFPAAWVTALAQAAADARGGH